jgi:hypothetical protein
LKFTAFRASSRCHSRVGSRLDGAIQGGFIIIGGPHQAKLGNLDRGPGGDARVSFAAQVGEIYPLLAIRRQRSTVS